MKPFHPDTKAFRTLIKGSIIGISILLIFTYLIRNSSIYYRTYNFAKPRLYFLRLNTYDLYLIKGEEYRLRLFAINKRVSFSSTNFRVAGVDFTGRVFGYRTGKAFILAEVDNRVLKCRVHVIDISRDNLTMKIKDTKRLRILGTNSLIRWKSANSRVASVSIFGTVKARKKGRTIIYAKTKGKTLKCIVRVK